MATTQSTVVGDESVVTVQEEQNRMQEPKNGGSIWGKLFPKGALKHSNKKSSKPSVVQEYHMQKEQKRNQEEQRR